VHTVPLDRAGDAKVCLGMWKSREGWTNNSGESRGLSWVEIGGAACDVVGSKQAADPGSKAARQQAARRHVKSTKTRKSHQRKSVMIV